MKYEINSALFIEAIRNFSGRRVLILGDLMLDRFVFGEASRVSPEAPVPVVEVKKEISYPGGAANVAVNIGSLGGVPVPVGIVGEDAEAACLRRELEKRGITIDGLIPAGSRPTCVKTRIIARHQQICRIDREDRSPLPAIIQKRVMSAFSAALPEADAVIISDYAKGLLSPPLLKQALRQASVLKKTVCVDPKLRDFSLYAPAYVITPNISELEKASGIPITGVKDLIRAGKNFLAASNIAHLLITRGEDGMTLLGKDAPAVVHIPAIAREVFDVTGAGDTVIATLTLGLTAGLSMPDAAALANFAAGIVVGKLGTASTTPEELIETIKE